MPQEFPSSNLVTTYNYLDFPGNGNCRFADCPGKWQMKVRKEEPAKKMLDFEWESSEVATVNAVREVVAPGSGKFPATNHPTHSSSLSCSNETCKLLKCSPTTSTIAPQSCAKFCIWCVVTEHKVSPRTRFFDSCFLCKRRPMCRVLLLPSMKLWVKY